MAEQVRVLCTLENAGQRINDVRFGPMPDGSGMLSEPIDQEVADNFCLIDGYAVPALDEATVAAVDAAIATQAETTPTDTSGVPLQQTIEELQRANQALSAELAAERDKKGPPAELRAERDALKARVAELEREVAALREANSRLGARGKKTTDADG